MKRLLSWLAIPAGILLPLSAHDTWVELSAARSGLGQPVFASLMLGNHGNNHRDFLLASKIPLKGTTLDLIAEPRETRSLLAGLTDRGSSEKEGFWSVRIVPEKFGDYCVAHTYEAIVSYAPKRAFKSAKAYFHAGGSEGLSEPGFFSSPLGHPLEILPLQDPTRLQAGGQLSVRVLFKDQPLADAVISCIPQGTELTADFDPRHEARTDAKGEATFKLAEANRYLIVTHQKAPDETGEGYSAGSEYGATLTILVGAEEK